MTGFTLTVKQAELLAFIDRHIAATGLGPSFQQMADAIGLKSKSGVHRLITALERLGRIRRPLGRSARAIEVVDQTRDQLRFLAPEVRNWVIRRAQMSNKLPETWLSIEMRKVMDREIAQGALTGAVIGAGQVKDARAGRAA
ncbi:MAG: lexA [Tardiphaga sp.]|nr:lexA [Tardiphaga sp.]